MTLEERIQRLETRDKTQQRRIDRLEAELKAAKGVKAPKSKYVTKLKGKLKTREDINRHIDNKFLKRNKKAA